MQIFIGIGQERKKPLYLHHYFLGQKNPWSKLLIFISLGFEERLSITIKIWSKASLEGHWPLFETRKDRSITYA